MTDTISAQDMLEQSGATDYRLLGHSIRFVDPEGSADVYILDDGLDAAEWARIRDAVVEHVEAHHEGRAKSGGGHGPGEWVESREDQAYDRRITAQVEADEAAGPQYWPVPQRTRRAELQPWGRPGRTGGGRPGRTGRGGGPARVRELPSVGHPGVRDRPEGRGRHGQPGAAVARRRGETQRAKAAARERLMSFETHASYNGVDFAVTIVGPTEPDDRDVLAVAFEWRRRMREGEPWEEFSLTMSDATFDVTIVPSAKAAHVTVLGAAESFVGATGGSPDSPGKIVRTIDVDGFTFVVEVANTGVGANPTAEPPDPVIYRAGAEWQQRIESGEPWTAFTVSEPDQVDSDEPHDGVFAVTIGVSPPSPDDATAMEAAVSFTKDG